MKKSLVIFSLFVCLFFVVGGCVPSVEQPVGAELVRNGESWCEPGSTWDIVTTLNDENMGLTVKELVTEGEHTGYCHLQTQLSEDSPVLDYYFDESESGYLMIDVDGEKSKIEI